MKVIIANINKPIVGQVLKRDSKLKETCRLIKIKQPV